MRRRTAAVLLIVVVITGAFGYVAFASLSRTVPPSVSATSSSACSITGQPGPFFLRVMSTSNLTGFIPIVGAKVTATNQPAFCGVTPATSQATLTFTTNTTMWYSLGSDNNAGYSIVVTYQGQSYSLKAALQPISVTCATLLIPSGETNVTITEVQTVCK
jgi:hypothetical protein